MAGGDHRGHDQGPDHRAEPPAGVKPGDDAGREAGGGEGVDGRVDGPGAEAGDEAPGQDQGPPRRRGPGGGARRHEEAARHEQPADAEPLEDGAGAEAGGEVARRHREEDQAQLVDRPVEAAPQRGPGDTQDAVGQAEAHEGEEGEGDDKAPRVARHGRLSPVRWVFDRGGHRLNRWLSALILLTLAACGGGGDSATTPTGGGTLVVEDLVVGTGATAVVGDTVTVNYVGTLTNGTKFDSSYDRGQPVSPFRLGAGQVIAGWDQGIPGMKVGGKRRLTIPPSLAYGSQALGSIPANSTLIFDVDLVSIAGK